MQAHNNHTVTFPVLRSSVRRCFLGDRARSTRAHRVPHFELVLSLLASQCRKSECRGENKNEFTLSDAIVECEARVLREASHFLGG